MRKIGKLNTGVFVSPVRKDIRKNEPDDVDEL